MRLLRRAFVALGLLIVAAYLFGPDEITTHLGALGTTVGEAIRSGLEACGESSSRIGW